MTARRSSRRRFPLVALIAVATVTAFAGGVAVGDTPFTDIDNTSGHHDNIEAIRLAGVTAGCTPTTYCPDASVTRAQMASFLARLGGLSSGTAKNFPKVNARGQSQAYCALAAANPGSYPEGPCRSITRTLASTGTVGANPSIAINPEGTPVISYFDQTNGDLKLATCSTASCSGANFVTVDDGDPAQFGAGSDSAVAIGADGFPVIAYRDDENAELRFVKCDTTTCSSKEPTRILDNTTTNVGAFPSIAIGSDGNPVISYRDLSAFDLRLVHCTAPDCVTWEGTVVDSAGSVGAENSIAVGTDGLPIISYTDGQTADLKVMHCGNVACSANNTPTTVDANGATGGYTDIAIGTDGLPVISYHKGDTEDLLVAHCNLVDCSTGATITALSTIGSTGRYTSIAIGNDGMPVISYGNFTTGDVEYADCSTRTCSDATFYVLDDLDPPSGTTATSIAIGIDGVPVVAYNDNTTGDLKVARAPV